MTKQTRAVVLNIGRVVLSVGLLAWVISRAGVEQLAQTLRAADWRWYALGLAVSTVSMFTRVARWQVLLRAVGVRAPFTRILYLYYVGAFYNTFLPTGFGGDVVRVLEFGEGATSQQATGTVLVDRLTGFIMLFALALVALPFVWALLPLWLALVIAGVAGGVMLGSVLLFEGKILRGLTARFPRALSLAGDAWLGKTYAVITACGQRAIVGALGWSLVFNLLHIGAVALVGVALGLTVSMGVYLALVPLATVALLIPITISGLGFREWMYVNLFGQLGLQAAQSTVLSFGSYSLDLFDGVVGGVVYLLAGLRGLRK